MSVHFLFPTRAERHDAADQLTSQAEACRRLAHCARTEHGATALLAAAGRFEADARTACPDYVTESSCS